MAEVRGSLKPTGLLILEPSQNGLNYRVIWVKVFSMNRTLMATRPASCPGACVSARPTAQCVVHTPPSGPVAPGPARVASGTLAPQPLGQAAVSRGRLLAHRACPRPTARLPVPPWGRAPSRSASARPSCACSSGQAVGALQWHRPQHRGLHHAHSHPSPRKALGVHTPGPSAPGGCLSGARALPLSRTLTLTLMPQGHWTNGPHGSHGP